MEKNFYFDGDFRRNPKTDFFCALCQKDLNPNSKNIQYVYVGDPALFVTDPERLEGNELKVPVGPECINKIPSFYRISS